MLLGWRSEGEELRCEAHYFVAEVMASTPAAPLLTVTRSGIVIPRSLHTMT